jgi:hypothetical protein
MLPVSPASRMCASAIPGKVNIDLGCPGVNGPPDGAGRHEEITATGRVGWLCFRCRVDQTP